MIDVVSIQAQLNYTLEKTNFLPGKKYEGKVRDVYHRNGEMIIITTDRISAFDRVLCTIPFKGQVLNQMANFWFEKTKDIVKNHVVAMPDPNVMVVKKCVPLPIEAVVRDYLTGVTKTSIWYNYERGVRNFCGNPLPEGMKKNQKLPATIFTPSTKAEKGDHDISVGKEYFLKYNVLTEEQFEAVKDISLKLFARGKEIAARQGIILVDTKYEFGTLNGEIVLMDEIHTPDSSRFWFANEYEERFKKGEEQKKIDKEYVREWLAAQGFVGEGEIPPIPDEVKVEAARRYIQAYELITGHAFEAEVGDVQERIARNLKKTGL